MTKTIVHVPTGNTLVENARWCATYWTKLRGFMFKGTLAEHEGLVLDYHRDSRLNASIHMMFVNFDLGVIWVNDAGEAVDIIVAKSWALNYSPKAPARYVVELHPSKITQVRIGDQIDFL